jgi:hypothetical protein
MSDSLQGNAGYEDSLKINEALQIYFDRYHFKNGGYDLKWFTIKMGPVYFPLPNIKSRVDAVKIHDIHHLVTGYEANMKGEVEIGGWEIGSGCGKYAAAWLLNFGSFFYGMLFYQKPLLRAFLNGRKCTTNLYYNVTYDETLLNTPLGEIKKRVGTNRQSLKNAVSDYLLFALYCFLLLTLAILFLAVPAGLILQWLT